MGKGISVSILKKRRDDALKRLSSEKHLMEGSLEKKRETCGNPNYRCAGKMEKTYFTYSHKESKRKNKKRLCTGRYIGVLSLLTGNILNLRLILK